jgi:two-component system chemotaxis response regulator CheB
MIKVFIIDDSMLVRNSIIKILKDETDIKVIGEAPNPIDAFEIFKKVGLPDVFILDIEMPKMDGLSFFKQINKQKPVPVIICSTLVSDGSSSAIDSLRLGAVDIILKPKINLKDFFYEQKEEIINTVHAASMSNVKFVQNTVTTIEKNLTKKVSKNSDKFIVIGSSTGGVQIIEEIVSKLKLNHRGIVITQHMPEGFTASFANRLNKYTNSIVVESNDNEIIQDNKVIISKGGIHTEIIKKDGNYYTVLKDYPKINHHKPSVNALFKSICKLDVLDVTAFILTGMGDDGALGIKKLKEKGYETYGQNKETCIVYGMSCVANQIGGIKKELSTDQIVNMINSLEG